MMVAARVVRGVTTRMELGVVGTLPLFLGATYGLMAFRPEAAIAPAIQTLGAGLLVAAYGALSRRRGGVLAGLAFAGAWILFEQVSILVGIPWSIALMQTPNLRVIQIASVLGMSAVSCALLLANVGIAEALHRAMRGCPARRTLRPVLAVALLSALLLVYGDASLRSVGLPDGSVPVALVQPALESELYTYQWLNPEYRHEVRTVVAGLSSRAAATAPGLLVWPENGNGQYNFRVPALREAVGELARRSGATLLLSSYDQDSSGRTFNAVFSVGPDGTILGRYSKLRLAPGGEEGFVPGEELAPLATPFGPVGALVCLESTLAWMARDLVRQGARLLLVTTSDVSMRHSIAPILHGRFSVFRAVENGRWLMLASNAGPSLVVDPAGRVRAESPLLARTTLQAGVAFGDRSTLYTHLGEPPITLLSALAVCVGLMASVRRRVTELPTPTWATAARHRAAGLAVSCALSAATVVASLGLLSGAPMSRWGELSHAFLRPAMVSVPADAGRPLAPDLSTNEAALVYALGLLGVDVAPGHAPSGALPSFSLEGLTVAARSFGMLSWTERHDLRGLEHIPKPVLADLGDHVAVVLAADVGTVDVFDPVVGFWRLPPPEFERRWTGAVVMIRFPPLLGIDRAPPTPMITESGTQRRSSGGTS